MPLSEPTGHDLQGQPMYRDREPYDHSCRGECYWDNHRIAGSPSAPFHKRLEDQVRGLAPHRAADPEQLALAKATLEVANMRIAVNKALDIFLEAETPLDRKRAYTAFCDLLDPFRFIVDELDTLREKAGR